MEFKIEGNKVFTSDKDIFEFHGSAVMNWQNQPRQYVNGEETKLVIQLADIIGEKDIDGLRQFHSAHPNITLYKGCVETCCAGCECGVYITPIDQILRSQTYTMQHECIPFTIGNDFFDVLFELGYLTDRDIYVVINMLHKLYDSEKWDDVLYLLHKMDKCALKSYVFEDLYGGKNYDRIQRFTGIGDALYHTMYKSYFGKPCEKIIECVKLLNELKIFPHDQLTGNEIFHQDMKFWNSDIEIKWQQEHNLEEFEKRDIIRWNTLPSSSEEIFL